MTERLPIYEHQPPLDMPAGLAREAAHIEASAQTAGVAEAALRDAFDAARVGTRRVELSDTPLLSPEQRAARAVTELGILVVELRVMAQTIGLENPPTVARLRRLPLEDTADNTEDQLAA